jgi:hypothetical protein
MHQRCTSVASFKEQVALTSAKAFARDHFNENWKQRGHTRAAPFVRFELLKLVFRRAVQVSQLSVAKQCIKNSKQAMGWLAFAASNAAKHSTA